MLVETYEQTEVDADGVVECEAEALELIEQLGLEGQQKLLSRKEGSDETVRCPYRKMTSEEGFIYGRLLTKHVKLHEYAEGPIPVRVLQVAAHARDMFDHLYVWSTENADIKDPILIGIKGEAYNGERFLLARWGDELETLANLAVLACQDWRNECKAKLSDIISDATSRLAGVDSIPDGAIVAGKKTAPAYYP
jgi:hypothetical protein